MEEDLVFFYEDAVDQLSIMENALLDCTSSDECSEDKIGELFRAMHTIKGNAGMFGFEQIISITHKAENLLDQARDGKITLDKQLISLLIDVKDITSALVEKEVNGEDLCEDLLAKIPQVESIILSKTSNESENQTPTESNINIKDNATEQADTQQWHISLRLNEDFFHSGMDLISILKFLSKQGAVEKIIPIVDIIPPFETIDPQNSYIGFEILYDTDIDEDEIIEVFEFIEDDIDLHVIDYSLEDLETLLDNREKNLKEILEQNNFYTFNTTETIETDNQLEDQIEVTIEQEEKTTTQNIAIETNLEINTKTIQKEIEPSKQPRVKSKIKKDENNFFLKVNSKKIDILIDKVGELIIKNAQLASQLNLDEENELTDTIESMQTLLDETRDEIMNVRMIQVKDSFMKYRRIVLDTANKLDKKIEFILEGEDTELDKSVVEKLTDPLTHMIRNSCDHGIETPEKRKENGKNPIGTIKLRTYPDAGLIVIEIEDDGGGLNKEMIVQKALSNGIITQDQELTDKEIFALIFEPGFSTAATVTSLSGRGVGMDVVKRNIEQLRGMIEVESTLKVGTKITIRLPLTLAIIDGFLVQSGHQKYIVPVEMIDECLEYTSKLHTTLQNSETINLRGEILPLLHLRKFYQDILTEDEEQKEEQRENILIVRFSKYKIALLVDELYGQQQTVIKPLGTIFQNVPGISGGSILGSGEIAFILDVTKLIENKINNTRGI